GAFFVELTRLLPPSQTTTRSDTPKRTTCVSGEYTMLLLESTAKAVPRIAFPWSSRGTTRPSADQVPTSSQPNSPGITSTRVLRSNTPTSTEIERTLPKNSSNAVLLASAGATSGVS